MTGMWKMLYVVFVLALISAQMISPAPWMDWAMAPMMAGFGIALVVSEHQRRAQTFQPGKKPRRGLILEQRWYDGRDHYNAQCDVLKRAEAQNERFLAGDPKGFYGDFPVGAEFMRPEYVMFEKGEPSSGSTGSVATGDPKKWSHDRKIGGDDREVIWSRIVSELLRIEHLRSLPYPGAQDQAEMLAIQRWIKRQAIFQRCSVEFMLGQTELWVRQESAGDASIAENVKAFFQRAEEVSSVGQSFPWDRVRDELRKHHGG